jgi:ribosome-associated protein
MTEQQSFLNQLLKALDDIQASDVTVIDVRKQTSVTDYMIICSGRSSRHVKAIADVVVEKMKAVGLAALSQNGFETGDWVLIDFGDFVLHIMQPESRAFYNLEGLWQANPQSK